MTNPPTPPAPAPAPRPPGRLSAWVQTHKPAAGGIAAATGVVLFALYRRAHPPAAAAGATTAGGSTDTGALTSGGDIAGLSGSPNTDPTDFGNALQDAINNAVTAVQGQLAAPTPPPAPATPTATAPKPGTALYKIKAGDTLSKIASQVYGLNDLYARSILRGANPSLASFTENAPLTFFVGETIRVPVYQHAHDTGRK